MLLVLSLLLLLLPPRSAEEHLAVTSILMACMAHMLVAHSRPFRTESALLLQYLILLGLDLCVDFGPLGWLITVVLSLCELIRIYTNGKKDIRGIPAM